MWMMGYSDGAEFNMADSLNGRKLRSLLPRPMAGSIATNNNGPCFRTINGPELLTFNHHITANGMGHERGKTRELAGAQQEQVVVSSRWNPTPEQLQTLEELYRRGIRTPSADQIQQITAQLRRFGKIEGKNVFYWFQNHKARERQKRRRQLETGSPTEENQQQIYGCVNDPERKESGVISRTVFEVEQTKSWIPSTNYSTLAEKSISMLEKGAKAGAECRTDGWVQLHEQREILHHHLIASSSSSSSSLLQMEKNATWQMMQSPTHHLLNTHINTNNNIIPPQAITTITAPITTMMLPSTTCSQEDQITNTNIWSKMGPRIFNHHNLVSTSTETSQTLQLFPLQGGSTQEEDDGAMTGKPTDMSDSTDVGGEMSGTPYHFFEFLPLKN